MTEKEKIEEGRRVLDDIKKQAALIGAGAAYHKVFGIKKITELMLRMYSSEKSNQDILTACSGKIAQNKRYVKLKCEKNFDDIFKAITQKSSVSLTKKQINSISKMKSLLLDDMNVETDKFQRAIKRSLLSNISRGKSQLEIFNELRPVAPKRMKRHVATVFNTYMQRTFRSATYESEANEYEYMFMYGLEDSLNRDGCAHHVGHTFNKNDAQRLQNKLASQWRCRHWLAGFVGTNEEAEALRVDLRLDLYS